MKKILLGICFANESQAAMEDAYMLAQRYSATIIPIHAVEYLPDYNRHHEMDMLIAQIKEQMKNISARLSVRGIDVYEPVIEKGDPTLVITSAAKVLDCDLIIIGAGFKGERRNTLGVTAKSIARCSTVPIWISNCLTEKIDYEDILCAVDLSRSSLQTLNDAASVARMLNATLHILHVEPKITYYPGLLDSSIPVSPWALSEYMSQMGSEDEYSHQHEEYILTHDFQEFIRNAELDDIHLKKYIKSGKASEEIIHHLESSEVGLLVMGTLGKSWLAAKILGGTIEKVLEKLPSSLLIIPHVKTL